MVNEKGEEVGIIYCWYCIPTDKYYVGQTIDEKGRFKRHINDAINKKENPKCSNIYKVCIGERKQAGGFIWKYA